MRMTREEAEVFLIEEARLLDENQFQQWLELFTDDCLYWLPTVDGDPDFEPSLIYDDHARLEERVYRITRTRAHAQDPVSRTLHNIANVAVADADEGQVRVHCNLMLIELRPGDLSQLGLGQQRMLAGRAEYLLTRTGDGNGWRIRQKKVNLINRDLPLYNITFIV
ncbi:MAG: Small subunit naph/bph dioxygenase [Noviherbaspirillum sp.]|jgi:3-phenylpropionate/cinnamic acid dioxygenase small subunit|nr:Small subunit naph/bph dioxygenase [Noviherbaspirillum sp.]MDB5794248.1 Small subunit naph/bph dioxygenase [Noviherbaspirillum sp.]